MKIIGLVILATLTAAASAQTPAGKWVDVSKDKQGWTFISSGPGGENTIKSILSEEFEVSQTHEICASVYGYFMEKSQQGRYDVNFKGLRTTTTFTFTTQYDAEHWVQKFCTPQSLLQIKNGHGDLSRKY